MKKDLMDAEAYKMYTYIYYTADTLQRNHIYTNYLHEPLNIMIHKIMVAYDLKIEKDHNNLKQDIMSDLVLAWLLRIEREGANILIIRNIYDFMFIHLRNKLVDRLRKQNFRKEFGHKVDHYLAKNYMKYNNTPDYV